jgi:hypothetical protein
MFLDFVFPRNAAYLLVKCDVATPAIVMTTTIVKNIVATARSAPAKLIIEILLDYQPAHTHKDLNRSHLEGKPSQLSDEADSGTTMAKRALN